MLDWLEAESALSHCGSACDMSLRSIDMLATLTGAGLEKAKACSLCGVCKAPRSQHSQAVQAYLLLQVLTLREQYGTLRETSCWG